VLARERPAKSSAPHVSPTSRDRRAPRTASERAAAVRSHRQPRASIRRQLPPGLQRVQIEGQSGNVAGPSLGSITPSGRPRRPPTNGQRSVESRELMRPKAPSGPGLRGPSDTRRQSARACLVFDSTESSRSRTNGSAPARSPFRALLAVAGMKTAAIAARSLGGAACAAVRSFARGHEFSLRGL